MNLTFLRRGLLTVCLVLSGLTMTAQTDGSLPQQVRTDFANRKAQLHNDTLFSVFSRSLTGEERDALTFLYAYMPLSDLVDHDADFYLANVRASLKARQEMPWGGKVPRREWTHFVLPIRVNNEDLDSSRIVFYDQLCDRIRGMSMADAALEVNHWCHEHVTYQPSDARTSSPLASIRTATGRCGEESTLTVAALRAIGIPARQVYTPRWAHTDDNHAWVEAWIDGRWCFMGACEPEPVLNLGWFNAPASRGMLMHTKAFGNYDGPEEVVRRTPRYTEINVIKNYAPKTGRADIQVVDEAGRPVEGATVEYKIYNYAEFFTVATKKTDAEGRSFLTAGCGDMLVWASRDGKFGFSKVTFGKDGVVTIALQYDRDHMPAGKIDMDIVPPPEHATLPPVTAAQRERNNERMAYEDSLRHAYEATFMNADRAREVALQHGYDSTEVAPLLVASKGNWRTISLFLAAQPQQNHSAAVDLLRSLSQKDLRDVTPAVLNDHLLADESQSLPDGESRKTFNAYVRCPRVSTELLTPWRGFFLKALSRDQQASFREDPSRLVDFVTRYVTVDPTCNLGGAPISPEGVWRARVADKTSRDIFFVALARTLGIPSQVDPVTGKVQMMADGKVVDVLFGAQAPVVPVKGFMKGTYKPTPSLDNPKYYTHFTISRITDSGSTSLMNYEEGEVDMGGGTTYDNLLRNGTSVEVGSYLLVSGTRLANGSVLAQLGFFRVNKDDTAQVNLEMRQAKSSLQVIGSFDSESRFTDPETGDQRSVLSVAGRGYYVLGVLGVGQEPTNHALRDISAVKTRLEQWGRKMVLLFPDREQYDKYVQRNEFRSLPSTVVYGIDTGGKILSQLRREMNLKDQTLPVFVVADSFNHVVFVSQGYTIGLGDQLLGVADKCADPSQQ